MDAVTDLETEVETDQVETETSEEAETSEETPDTDTESEDEQVEGEDPESPDTPTHKVKVDGRIYEVELDELINGYQRQAHTTRAQQALAAEKAQLAQAAELWQRLETDPAATMTLLQEHFADVLDNQEDLDPEQKRIAELEAFVDNQRQVMMEAELQQTLADLHEEFGEFDDDELFVHALETQKMDLEDALTHLQRQKARETRKQDATTKKRSSPVQGGVSKAAGSTSRQAKAVDSVGDAFQEALDELGMRL